MRRLEIAIRLIAGSMGDPQTSANPSDEQLDSWLMLADRILAAERRRVEALNELCPTCGGTKLVPNKTFPRLDDPEWWPCPVCAGAKGVRR